MFDDDDFKISMDDIKDMVSEYFGEKIDKVDKTKAKEILTAETKELFESDFTTSTEEDARKKEEEILKEYEDARVEIEKEKMPEPSAASAVEAQELKRRLEDEMRERIKKELEDAAARKKEETLKRLEAVKQDSKAYQDSLAAKSAEAAAAPADRGILTTHAEKITLMQMFDHSQKALFNILIKLIRKNAVETMYIKTLEKAMAKNRDVLRKVDHNNLGQVRIDGSLEMGRLAANVNALYAPEAKKNEMFLAALNDIFEERLIATELATSIETKDDVMSTLLNQLEQAFPKKGIDRRLIDIFIGHIVPSTTVKPGE